MARLTIRRFDVIRTANVVAVLYAVIVLAVGLIFIVPLALIGAAATAEYGGATVAGSIVGVLVFLALGVVLYAGLGWIFTALVCALYNAVAARMGGLRIEVDVEGTAPGVLPAGAWQTPATGYLPPGSATPGGPPQPPTGWGSPPA